MKPSLLLLGMKPHNGQQLLHWVTVTMHVQMYTNLLALVELIMNHTKLFIYSKYVLSVCVRARARVCVCVCIMAPNDKQYPCVIYYLSQAQVEGESPLENGKNWGSTPRCFNLSFTS